MVGTPHARSGWRQLDIGGDGGSRLSSRSTRQWPRTPEAVAGKLGWSGVVIAGTRVNRDHGGELAADGVSLKVRGTGARIRGPSTDAQRPGSPGASKEPLVTSGACDIEEGG